VNWAACSQIARCTSERCECQIHMKDLFGAPYMLQQGDPINARARSRNQIGYSPYSE
jgi:hypothetical protein